MNEALVASVSGVATLHSVQEERLGDWTSHTHGHAGQRSLSLLSVLPGHGFQLPLQLGLVLGGGNVT